MTLLKKLSTVFLSLLLFFTLILGGASNALAVDPNCTVQNNNNGPFANPYPNAITDAIRDDATTAISRLQFADLFRNPPFRIVQTAVRLDVQGGIANNGRNWQVQVNNVRGSSTIALALIHGNLANASTIDRQRYVERSFRNALNQSLTSRNGFTVNGVCN